MKTVTLCGSMRFSREMMKIAAELELRHGMNVLQCIYDLPGTELSRKELETLAAAHCRKIDLSDAVYVVDLGGYIGDSVRREIAYAREKGREVIFHTEFCSR